jgi:aspartyl-tRNA synthetase
MMGMKTFLPLGMKGIQKQEDVKLKRIYVRVVRKSMTKSRCLSSRKPVYTTPVQNLITTKFFLDEITPFCHKTTPRILRVSKIFRA